VITQFYRPKTVKEALLIHKEKPVCVYLAGGTEINRLNSTIEAKAVISLQDLKLNDISVDEHGLHLGSMVTFTQALESPLVPDFLKDALLFCGSKTKRNMATIGGNVALCSDDSYLMCTLLASRARVVTRSMAEDCRITEENLPLREYHAYYEHYQNVLLVALEIPDYHRYVFSRRFAKTMESHSSVVCAFGCEDETIRRCSEVRMYAAVKGTGVQRFKKTENALEQGPVDRVEFHKILESEIQATDDLSGSAAYKRYLVEEALYQMYEQYRKEKKA